MLRKVTEAPLSFPIRDAASWLGVSISSVRKWSDAGVLACYRTPGRQRRFSESALELDAEDQLLKALELPQVEVAA
jgi:excisionase family DNA binding protein